MVSGPSPNTCDVVELTFKNSCELPGVQLVGCTTLLVLATGSAVLAGTLTCTVAVLPSESVTISVSIPTGAEIVKVYGALPDGVYVTCSSTCIKLPGERWCTVCCNLYFTFLSSTRCIRGYYRES